MMSGAVVLSPNFNLYSAFSASTVNRLEVPVSPSQVLYAQLKYVEGVPSESGGVSLDRLRVIDSLIAQINAHRPAGTPPVKIEQVNVSQPDSAIVALADRAWQMQKMSGPFQSWGQVAGLAFDMRA